MLYYLYEMNHAALAPWRAAADAGLNFWRSPANPFAETQMGRSVAASPCIAVSFRPEMGISP